MSVEDDPAWEGDPAWKQYNKALDELREAWGSFNSLPKDHTDKMQAWEAVRLAQRCPRQSGECNRAEILWLVAQPVPRSR